MATPIKESGLQSIKSVGSKASGINVTSEIVEMFLNISTKQFNGIITRWKNLIPNLAAVYVGAFRADGKVFFDTLIQKFYSDYTPKMYKRHRGGKGDLQDLYELDVDNDEILLVADNLDDFVNEETGEVTEKEDILNQLLNGVRFVHPKTGNKVEYGPYDIQIKPSAKYLPSTIGCKGKLEDCVKYWNDLENGALQEYLKGFDRALIIGMNEVLESTSARYQARKKSMSRLRR